MPLEAGPNPSDILDDGMGAIGFDCESPAPLLRAEVAEMAS